LPIRVIEQLPISLPYKGVQRPYGWIADLQSMRRDDTSNYTQIIPILDLLVVFKHSLMYMNSQGKKIIKNTDCYNYDSAS
jgi:hypothetical protein